MNRAFSMSPQGLQAQGYDNYVLVNPTAPEKAPI